METQSLKCDDFIDVNKHKTNNKPSDPCYEIIVSCVGGIFGIIGTYICCFCNPYITVDEGHEIVITRFGRYNKTFKSGCHYIRPLTDDYRIISTMITIIELSSQKVTTSDNNIIYIDMFLYYKIIDTYIATFGVTNMRSHIDQVVVGALGTCFSSYTLEDCLINRIQIEINICEYMEKHTYKWGVVINGATIKNIKLHDSKLHETSQQLTITDLIANKVKTKKHKTKKDNNLSGIIFY